MSNSMNGMQQQMFLLQDLSDLGFIESSSGIHTSRTMMLQELDIIMSSIQEPLTPAMVRNAIIEDNILGKSTYSGRMNTAAKLVALYSFAVVPLYTIFDRLYRASVIGRPAIALLMALSRDGVLREVLPLILRTRINEPLDKNEVATTLLVSKAMRFTEKTRNSTIRNILGSLRAAGCINRGQPSVRTPMQVDGEAVTFAVLIAWMRGKRGDDILASPWMQLLNVESSQLDGGLRSAHRIGLLNSRIMGKVVDISPGPLLREILGT